MANPNQGGRGSDHASQEQHVKSGQQGHNEQESKQASPGQSSGSSGQRGSHDQHVKAGQQGHKHD